MDKYKNPISSYKIKFNTEDAQKLKAYWGTGIGLNKVDGLQPSDYLIELAKKHIDGEITSDNVNEELKSYYKKQNTNDKIVRQTMECDLVSKRIVDLLDNGSFTFSPLTLKHIHGYLFKDIMEEYSPGQYRWYNISKKEDILYGQSVNYGAYDFIEANLTYDFEEERGFHYSYPMNYSHIKHLTRFVSHIWQAHPFREGNTRTTAVFTELYLRNMGFDVNNYMFQQESQYFRNALVRNNYINVKYKIYETDEFLIYFFDNLINHTNHILNHDALIYSSMSPLKKMQEQEEELES